MPGARPLIIPGGQRCGSTWLARFLDSHPEINLARPYRPEPKVFLDPNAGAADWWRRCSPQDTGDDGSATWVAEKSTSYLERPEVIGRIWTELSDVEVVAVIRDPVERAISNWRFSTFNGLEDRPAEVALDPEHTLNGDAVTNDDGNSPATCSHAATFSVAATPSFSCRGVTGSGIVSTSWCWRNFCIARRHARPFCGNWASPPRQRTRPARSTHQPIASRSHKGSGIDSPSITVPTGGHWRNC